MEKKKEFNTKTLTLMAFGIALNIIGAFIALTFRLPNRCFYSINI